jgi:uncharacterized membrane protein YfcA
MIFGVTPFDSVSTGGLTALVLLYVFAYLLRGVIGFGSATPAVLGCVWIVPPHDAVILAILTSLAAQIVLLPRGIRTCDRKILPPMLLGAALAIVFGTWIFATLNAQWLTIVIGAILVFAVFAERFKLTERVIEGRDLRNFKIPFCLTSFTGILSGISGVGANLLLSVYVRWAAPNPVTFRGTNMAYSGFAIVWRVIVLALGSLLSLKLIIESIILVPAVLLGAFLGLKLGDKIEGERYFHIIQIVLVVAAVALFWKGFAALT